MTPNVTPYLQYGFLVVAAILLTILTVFNKVEAQVSVPLIAAIFGIGAPSPSQNLPPKAG